MTALEKLLAEVRLLDPKDYDGDDQHRAAQLLPLLARICEEQQKALEYYANTESSKWDHSTAPPRLFPTMGYGPFNAQQAIAAVEALAGGDTWNDGREGAGVTWAEGTATEGDIVRVHSIKEREREKS